MSEQEIGKWSDRFNRHKGLAAVFGGFLSVTVGATWWLAKGGAVAFITSVTALSNPDVARVLASLPKYHEAVERGIADIANTQTETHDALLQITDALETMRRDSETVVEWAPAHSQRLTDAVGGCYAGDVCVVYFRGRRTHASEGCVLTILKPRLVLGDGREFPVTYADDNPITQLTTEFETIESRLKIPEFIPAGLAGVVVLTVYSDCGFAGEGELVSRETFRLLVEIKRRD